MTLLSNLRIIKRFPNERQKIIDLCVDDKLVGELCEDYEKVIDALAESVIEINNEQEPIKASMHQLLQLKQALEQELMERLARSKTS